MSLTTAGRDLIATALVGDSYVPYNAANSHIGVGDSPLGFDPSQTDLLGAGRLRRPMEAGYPQRVANALTFRALYGTGEANFDWEEWAVFNAVTFGQMLNRKVETLGSKTSVQSWQLTVTLTVLAAP